MIKKTCRNCGKKVTEFLVDGKFCNKSCKKINFNKYKVELKRLQWQLYKKYCC